MAGGGDAKLPDMTGLSGLAQPQDEPGGPAGNKLRQRMPLTRRARRHFWLRRMAAQWSAPGRARWPADLERRAPGRDPGFLAPCGRWPGQLVAIGSAVLYAVAVRLPATSWLGVRPGGSGAG